MTEQSTKTKVVKEEFCGACIAIPLALAGAGVGVAGTKQKGDHQKRKKIMLCGGIGVAIVSIIIALYYISSCKDCR